LAFAVAAAQFRLDRLQLFVEVIFALGLFHLALHAATDLALNLQHAQFAFHEGVGHFQPLERIGFGQQGLFVATFAWICAATLSASLRSIDDIAQVAAGILRQLLVELGIFGELVQRPSASSRQPRCPIR
jgi:hypothetical protein